jgi:recombination endonuclease VII
MSTKHFHGKPHTCGATLRYISTRKCVICTHNWAKANPERVKKTHEAWRKRNPRKHVANGNRWAAANPERIRFLRRRSKGIVNADGFRPVGKPCACCGEVLASRGKHAAEADHDHSTGFFRGHICRRCNTRLGVIEDRVWVQQAMRYLEGTAQQRQLTA